MTESDPKEERIRDGEEKPKERDGMGEETQKAGSEIWEAARIFFVVVRDGENGLVELVIAELLKRHSGRDGGKHGDVWKNKQEVRAFSSIHFTAIISD